MTDPGERSFPPRQGYRPPEGYGGLPQRGYERPRGYGAREGYGPPASGGWQPPDRPPQRGYRVLAVFLIIAGAILVLAVTGVLASLRGTGTNTDSGSGAAVANSGGGTTRSEPAPPGRHTIIYVTTGSSAYVNYGPAGSSHAGKVPMRVIRTLRSPAFYWVTVQLNGSGRVRCKILVDHKVISSAVARGRHNIASCVISKDPRSGKWAADPDTG